MLNQKAEGRRQMAEGNESGSREQEADGRSSIC